MTLAPNDAAAFVQGVANMSNLTIIPTEGRVLANITPRNGKPLREAVADSISVFFAAIRREPELNIVGTLEEPMAFDFVLNEQEALLLQTLLIAPHAGFRAITLANENETKLWSGPTLVIDPEDMVYVAKAIREYGLKSAPIAVASARDQVFGPRGPGKGRWNVRWFDPSDDASTVQDWHWSGGPTLFAAVEMSSASSTQDADGDGANADGSRAHANDITGHDAQHAALIDYFRHRIGAEIVASRFPVGLDPKSDPETVKATVIDLAKAAVPQLVRCCCALAASDEDEDVWLHEQIEPFWNLYRDQIFLDAA
jgi:hypothetical protein